MQRKLRVAAVDESSRVAPSPGVVKRLSRWAVDNCDPRFAVGAVKADSRAQRGRSEAQRLEGDNANRTMESDAHQIAQALNVNVAAKQRCESRRNWAQESTEFCTPSGAINCGLEQRQRGVSDHGPWPRA
jgi:hypothetical protein